MTALSLALAGAASFLVLPTSLLLVQVLASFLPPRGESGPRAPRPRLAVLVPAHDEEAGIGGTLASLIPELAEGDRVLVVADNCADDTAERAREGGAEVVIRVDPERRGKGFALDFGLRHLAAAPPEVVICIDADCRVEPGTLERLAILCVESGRPAQSANLMRFARRPGPRSRLAEFAWLFHCWVRPLGFLRLGLSCPLMGTGMAFPWKLSERLDFASSHLTEDMKLGVDLALAGFPARFCPEAQVTSHFPEVRSAIQSQRTRWEHGHLSLILRETPRLLLASVRRRDLRLLAFTLDFAVPPLALLTAVLSGVALLSLSTVAATPGRIAAAALAVLFTAIVLAWARWGRAVVSLVDLLRAPIYVLAKLPLYARYLIRRQSSWIRTERG